MLRFKVGESAIYAIPERTCEQKFIGTHITVLHVGPFKNGQYVDGIGTVNGDFDYAIDIIHPTLIGTYMLGVKDWQLAKLDDPDAEQSTEQEEELCTLC